MKAVPRLGNQFNPVPIPEWWAKEAIFRFQNQPHFRRHLVRTAANMDGASHVDSKLDKFYEDLEAGGQLKLVLNGQNLVYPNNQAPYDQSKPQHWRNVHLAMLRQFAHEVLSSASHYNWIETLSKRP